MDFAEQLRRNSSWVLEEAAGRAKTLHRQASSVTAKVADTITEHVNKVGTALEESEARGDGELVSISLGGLGGAAAAPATSHFETVDLSRRTDSMDDGVGGVEAGGGYSYAERSAQLAQAKAAQERASETSPAGTPTGGVLSWLWGSSGKYAPVTPAKPSRGADDDGGDGNGAEGEGVGAEAPSSALGKLWHSVRRGSQHVGAAVGLAEPPPSLTPRTDAFIARLEKLCPCCPELSYTTRLIVAAVLVCLAVGFFALAYLIGIPVLLVAPDKFALCFTFGTAMFMAGVVVLDGPLRYIRRLGSLHRAGPLTAVVLTAVGTIVASFGVQNLFRSVAVIVVSVLQIVALVWYGFAFIPGGVTGLKFVAGRLCGLCARG
jgi:hypothetical protein